MAIQDFDAARIEIRDDTDLWGPYLFNFPTCSSATSNDGVLPYGATIATVAVYAYEGKVKPLYTLASMTTFDSIIEIGAATPSTINDTGTPGVRMRLQMPATDRKGTRATLRFLLTMKTTHAVYPFYFPYVWVM